jgi:8-amino-7-oxononanoate synthase
MTGEARAHILPIVLGSPERAIAVSGALLRAGYHVPAIRPPTVPSGTARLRLSLTAAFSEADVLALVEALAHAVQGAEGES